MQLARRAAKLIPLVANGRELRGFSKKLWKLRCAFITHRVLAPAELEQLIAAGGS